MTRKADLFILGIVLFPLLAQSVLAAEPMIGSLPSVLQPVVDIIGPQGLLGLYTPQTAPLWDSILVLIVFITLAMSVFKNKHGGGKAIPVVVGIIFTLGYLTFAYKIGPSLTGGEPFSIVGFVGPLVMLIILGGLVFVFYRLFHYFITNKAIAFLAAFTLIFWFIPPEVLAWLYLQGGPAFSWLQLIASIGTVTLLVLLIMAIIRVFRGTGRGAGASGGAGDTGSIFSNLGSSARENLSDQEKAVRSQEAQREASENARRVAETVNTNLQSALGNVGRESEDAAGALNQIKQYLQQTKQFLESIHDQIEPDLAQGVDQKGYRQNIAGYKQSVNEYFDRINEIHTQLSSRFAPEFLQAIERVNQDERQRFAANQSASLYGDAASYEGWLSRELSYAGSSISAATDPLQQFWKELKIAFDNDVEHLRDTETRVQRLYRLPTERQLAYKAAEEAFNKAAAGGVNLQRVFGSPLDLARLNNQIGTDIVALEARARRQRELLVHKKETIGKVSEEHRTITKALDERESLREQWKKLLLDLKKQISSYRDALLRYIENPASGYRSPIGKVDRAIETIDTMLGDVTKEHERTATVSASLARITQIENDTPELRSFVQTFFEEFEELLTLDNLTIARIEMLLFYSRIATVSWSRMPNNGTTPTGTIAKALDATKGADQRKGHMRTLYKELNEEIVLAEKRLSESRSILEQAKRLTRNPASVDSVIGQVNNTMRDGQNALNSFSQEWNAILPSSLPP